MDHAAGVAARPSLFVLPSDEEEAGRIDRARYAIEVPGVTAEEALPQAAARPRRQHPADDLDVKLCPRCGGEYQLWAETCADCGVALVRPWDLETALRKEVPEAPTVAGDPGACPACGGRLQEGDTECPGCGLMLAQPEVCPNCGEELEAYTASCRLCGQQLFETPTPERS